MNQMTTFQNEPELLQEDWQAKAERLEQLVCVLMLKNQALRMELVAGRAKPPGDSRSPGYDSCSRV